MDILAGRAELVTLHPHPPSSLSTPRGNSAPIRYVQDSTHPFPFGTPTTKGRRAITLLQDIKIAHL
jgi:hypothetical protein